MPSNEKKCGRWGNFLYGDIVEYRGARYQIAKACKRDGPKSFAPIIKYPPDPNRPEAFFWAKIKELKLVRWSSIT